MPQQLPACQQSAHLFVVLVLHPAAASHPQRYHMREIAASVPTGLPACCCWAASHKLQLHFHDMRMPNGSLQQTRSSDTAFFR
jgi:hypothetical protein